MLCCLFDLMWMPFTLLGFCLSGCGMVTILVIVTGLYLTKLYFGGGRCNSNARLDGKTAIITGGNSGIGKEAARDFLRRGCRVIIACRDAKKGVMAAAELQLAGSKTASLVVKQLDLASFKSIRSFCDDILKTESRIDILLNNAGVMRCPEWKTEDGLEMQIGTNHFGHFLLTNLLLNKIKESKPSRIVNVASLSHASGTMNFQNINLTGEYDPATAYRQSKLANVLFTRKLAKDLEGSGVSVFSLHPGVIMTNLGRHLIEDKPWLGILLRPIAPIFFKNVEQGAQTSIYCSVQEGIEDKSGLYFSDCKVKEASAQGQDDGAATKLWELSEKLTGLNQ